MPRRRHAAECPDRQDRRRRAGAKGDCTACHTSAGSATLKKKGQELCFTCHETLKPAFSRAYRHPPLDSERACLTCHGPHTATAKPMLTMKQDDLCMSCHGKALFRGKFRHAALEQGCASCHDPHSADSKHLLKAPEAKLCTTCHADLSKHFHKTTSDKTAPLTGEPLTCTGCHSPHTADIAGLLKADPKPALCVTCHDPTLFPDVK